LLQIHPGIATIFHPILVERGVHFSDKGEKHAVLVLSTDQVVRRLSEALQAPPLTH